jgi:hypothetical protein
LFQRSSAASLDFRRLASPVPAVALPVFRYAAHYGHRSDIARGPKVTRTFVDDRCDIIRERRANRAAGGSDSAIGRLIGHFPSPTASRISTSAEQSQPFNPVAQIATILNDILAISVGSAFLELHCLCTYNAANEIDQRAFIVVQLMFLLYPFPLSPNSTKAAVSLMRWDTSMGSRDCGACSTERPERLSH